METEPKTICGGCLCGAVRYEGIGELYNVTHCHCEDCRKSAGALFVTWASFQRSNLKFTKGKPLEIAWAGRVRSFCATCGTALTLASQPDADENRCHRCHFRSTRNRYSRRPYLDGGSNTVD